MRAYLCELRFLYFSSYVHNLFQSGESFRSRDQFNLNLGKLISPINACSTYNPSYFKLACDREKKFIREKEILKFISFINFFFHL